MWTRFLGRGVAMVVVTTLTRTAWADPDAGANATCDRLEATAHAEAVVLEAPRIQIMGARTPIVADASDPTASAASLWQARAALALSPTSILQGRTVERIARSECRRTKVSDRLGRLIALRDQIGERQSVEAELATLRRQLTSVDAIVTAATERLANQRGSLVELVEVREARSQLLAHLAALEQHLATLTILDTSTPGDATRITDLARDYHDASIATARGERDLRSLRAWRVDVQGGVAAGEKSDWFAVVQFEYSIGGLFQKSANDRALRARERELATSDREMTGQVAELRRLLAATLSPLQNELAAVDRELAELQAELAQVANVDSDAARHLRDRLTIELVSLTARRDGVAALIAARRPYADVQGAP